jgi:hypothetical protein
VRNVAAKKSSEPSHGYAVHTRSWESIVGFYHDLIWNGWAMLPMLGVVEAIAASSVASKIYAATSMNTLLLSDSGDLGAGDGPLEITYQADERTFRFHHCNVSGQDDGKICSEAEAMQTLRLFLRLKYGILFEVPEP